MAHLVLSSPRKWCQWGWMGSWKNDPPHLLSTLIYYPWIELSSSWSGFTKKCVRVEGWTYWTLLLEDFDLASRLMTFCASWSSVWFVSLRLANKELKSSWWAIQSSAWLLLQPTPVNNKRVREWVNMINVVYQRFIAMYNSGCKICSNWYRL